MDIAVNYEYREDDMRSLLDIEALAQLVIAREGKPDDTEVSINFVTDEAIHELNREYRGVDRPSTGRPTCSRSNAMATRAKTTWRPSRAWPSSSATS